MLLRNRHNLWVRLAFALGAMALFVLGYQWGNQHQRRDAAPSQIAGVLIRPSAAIPNFELRDPFGQTMDLSRLEDRWTLLAFGDLAQASGQRALQRLIDARNRVADQHALRQSLPLILVATQDTPALARDFARISPALHVLGGNLEEVARLQAAVGADTSDPSAGPVLFLFDPDGHLIALFPDDEAGHAVAEDLKALVSHAPALFAE